MPSVFLGLEVEEQMTILAALWHLQASVETSEVGDRAFPECSDLSALITGDEINELIGNVASASTPAWALFDWRENKIISPEVCRSWDAAKQALQLAPSPHTRPVCLFVELLATEDRAGENELDESVAA